MITETQIVNMALTFVPMIIAVLIGILMNNARLGDVRDLLRVEIKSTREVLEATMEKNQSEMLHRFAELDTRIGRIESSLGMQR